MELIAMFNEELIKGRKQMLVQQLIYDKISNLIVERKEEKDSSVKRSIDKKIKYLENICDNVDSKDVTFMSKEDKEIVIKLLEVRINDIEDGRVRDSADPMESIVDFIVYEYKLLLKEFLVSKIEEAEVYVKKNKN